MSTHENRHDMASKMADMLKASILAAFEDMSDDPNNPDVNIGIVRFCNYDESGGGAEEIHIALFDTDYAIRIRVDDMEAQDSVTAIGNAVANEMLDDAKSLFTNTYMNEN